MFSRERETESLLNNDYVYGHRIRKDYLKTYNWRLMGLALLSGFISLLIWVTVFHTTSYPLLSQPPGENLMLPFQSPLLSASNSFPQPNITPWEKSEVKKLKYSFGNYSSKTFINKYKFNNGSIPTKPATPPSNFMSISTVGNTTVYTYNLVVSEGTICADNFVQKGFLINGQTPGPELRVSKHSIIVVHVTNNLNSEITFHFHGIHQRKSFLSDGVPMVTQKPIPPGASFTHAIDTWPQAGTFFYHAHTAMDIIWLYGPMIIEDDHENYKTFGEEYQYDEDRVFIINGIYHEPLEELMDRIAGPIHSYPAVTSSITINGKSFGLWQGENASNYSVNGDAGEYASWENKTGYYVTTVEQGKKYRLRFINAASDSLLSCNITSHKMTVIETDGVYMDPVETDHLVLTPGQRYSVIVKMDQEVGNYRMLCMQMESSGPLNGVAILNYEGAIPPSKEILKEDRPGAATLELDRWVIEKLGANVALNQTDFYHVPTYVDKEFVIEVFEAVVGQQHMYLINGHFFEEPAIPYYMQLKQGINISNPPQVYEIEEGESIQFVFQNQRTGDFCFSHPWHIHGHSFHVVGEGADRYDPVKDGQRINQDIEEGKKFQFRDTVTVYGNQTIGEYTDGAFCGWAAIRFWAKNPGVWLAHCHVTPHMIMGKKFIIWEKEKDDPFLSKLMNAKRRV